MGLTDDQVVEALQPFSACDVSDALLKLKHPYGGFLSDLILWSPERQAGKTKIIGPAYTVKYVLNSDTTSPKLSTHYIDTIPPKSVVFVSSPKIANAVYGGLMGHRSKASGAVGAVIDGRIRDLEEHREMRYPIFAKNVGTTAPYETVRTSEINVPVTLQTADQVITINPGDFIIGDLNGVVCLPRELAGQAIPLMAPQVEADNKITRDLDAGIPFAEASKRHRGK